MKINVGALVGLFVLICCGLETVSAQCCNGTVVLNQDFGTVTCNNYTNLSNCTWLIVPANEDTVITLQLTYIDTESCCDIVTVFDGPSDYFPSIAKLSGISSHPGNPVVSSEGYLTVTFVSDGSNDGGNFSFTYSSGGCLADNYLSAQGYSFTDGSGDEKYLPSESCAWFVNSTTPVDEVTFYFNHLDLDPQTVVSIYSGESTTGPLIGTYGNKTHYDPIVVSSGQAAVTFTSGATGASYPWQGFNLTYTAGYCQGFVNLQNVSGSFTDGSGNLPYFNGINCSWLVTPSSNSGDIITFYVATLNTESCCDKLTIYDGSSSEFPALGVFSGNNTLGPVYTSTNIGFVNFETDGSNNEDGFEVQYIVNGCLPKVAFTAASASFTDGSGPANTSVGTCTWDLNPVVDAIDVNLTTIYFTHVELGAGDSITVFDGTGAVAATVSGQFLRTVDPIPVAGSNISFQLNTVTGGHGFNVEYYAGRCLPFALYTNQTGTLTAGQGAGGDYLNGIQCIALIQPNGTFPHNSSVGILFDFVDTEAYNDYVKVYDGPSTSFPQLADLSGSVQKAGPFYSSSNVLTVEFYSDGSTNGLGFSASYSVVNKSN